MSALKTHNSRRHGISTASLIGGAVLWLAVFASLAFVWQKRTNDPPKGSTQVSAGDTAPAAASAQPEERPKSQSTAKLKLPARKLPDFEFEKCTGGTLSLEDLKGKRWVASFIFTSCTETCPTITAAVMRVHDRVKESAPDVQFVTITVYPKVDTAEILKRWSETFTQGDRSRWNFLTGSQQEIYELVVKGFGLFVKENIEAERYPGLEVAHSNRVVLVNEEGFPVGTFLGTEPGDMAKLARILRGADEFPVPGPALSFSTSDGSPLDIQFQLKPVEEEPETRPSDVDEPETHSKKVKASQAAATPAKPQSVAEHNAAIDQRLPKWAQQLPSVNAGLNSLAAILLVSGFTAIKGGRRQLHRNLMISAFLTSVVFLACYLTYHYALGKYTGAHGRKFSGDGAATIFYQTILWPHIVLAAAVPVLAIRVFQHAFAERWDAHKQLAKVTFPIWMFVSVTGVVIYGMLYHWPE